MLKYVVIVFASFTISAYSSSSCSEKKECSTTYLDIARDLILKAKRSISECQEIKEVQKCPERKAVDCADWYNRGYIKSGVHTIWPMNRLFANKSFDVYCDMENDGGGWTVIQRRGNFGNPSDYFNKDWKTYKNGFGDFQKEFWLGNDKIFALTNQNLYSIRFDLQDKELKKAYANYFKFWIDDEDHKYSLHIFNYSGNAGNAMEYHNNRNFSTFDQNNIQSWSINCAEKSGGPWWWYTGCGASCVRVCLNGLYKEGRPGIGWMTFNAAESLIWTEMKIRPENFVTKKYFNENVNKLPGTI